MNQVTIPHSNFNRILLRSPSRAVYAAGRRQSADGLELVYHSAPRTRSLDARLQSIVADQLCPLFISSGWGVPEREEIDAWLAQAAEVGAETVGVICMTLRGDEDLEVRGLLVNHGQVQPIDYLFVPGPFMNRVRVFPLWSESEDGSGGGPPRGDGDRFEERLARFLPLFGERTVRRAQGLRVAVVGASRSGSLLMYGLVFYGVGRHGGILLVDGDRVERHNLDIMMVPEQCVGMPKAQAVAGVYGALVPGANIQPVHGTLSDEPVASAVGDCDVIFTGVDNDAARWAAACLARRYHRVHLDCAASALRDEYGGVQLGGEARVSVPGTPGCAGCFGETSREDAVAALIRSREEEQAERAASSGDDRLASFNAILMQTVGQALSMFWGIVSGSQQESRWLHYDHGPDGRPRWSDWTGRAQRRCPLCSAEIQGAGDRPVRTGAAI